MWNSVTDWMRYARYIGSHRVNHIGYQFLILYTNSEITYLEFLLALSVRKTIIGSQTVIICKFAYQRVP